MKVHEYLLDLNPLAKGKKKHYFMGNQHMFFFFKFFFISHLLNYIKDYWALSIIFDLFFLYFDKARQKVDMGPEHLTWISLSSGESKLRLEHKLRELVSESVANSHERNTEIGQSFVFAGFT